MLYCLKCKKKTEDGNRIVTETNNKRLIIKAKCEVCNCKKTQFISRQNKTGGDLQAFITEKYPDTEFHVPFHNYTGPGTKLSKKIEKHDEFVDDIIKSAGKPPDTKVVRKGLFRRKKRIRTTNADKVEHIIRNAKFDHKDERVKVKPHNKLDEASFKHDHHYLIADKLCKGDKKCVQRGKTTADKIMIKQNLKNTIKPKNFIDRIQNLITAPILTTKVGLEKTGIL